jgi:hypothetical protein
VHEDVRDLGAAEQGHGGCRVLRGHQEHRVDAGVQQRMELFAFPVGVEVGTADQQPGTRG